MRIKFILNNKEIQITSDPSKTLLEVLRTDLGLTGTKYGCGVGECGTCTVIVDGRAVSSCLTLIGSVEGKRVETIEGLSDGESLHPVQESFIKNGAVQCGYCTPGMVMSAKALLDRNRNPTEEEIKEAIAGNLCRCTGYNQIIKAIKETEY